MTGEASLREQAREAIPQGELPSRTPERTCPGVGAACTVCAQPVTKQELEFEIQFSHDEQSRPGQVPRSHPVLRGLGVRAERAAAVRMLLESPEDALLRAMRFGARSR